jgi:hypothetical protein
MAFIHHARNLKESRIEKAMAAALDSASDMGVSSTRTVSEKSLASPCIFKTLLEKTNI